ncbi:MAG: ABC transporter ATP-binding protein [Treponema sp.]|uniref:ABC transporter ATP-binding protein n=1 Tax=Treponema sp. TaxID=166 RepID=UPI00298DE2EF|nr:ABC transporter ATP-binding protein [Treponema sp.]MBR5932406.1 ABC transporter ATP-binding protein [Treponema sp.]
MIEIKNLSAGYTQNLIFENVNLTIEDSSFTALCGRNGSGKSTLLSLIDGIIPAGMKVTGKILIDGKDIFSLKRKEAAKLNSYLVQNERPVWNFTVRQFVETGLYSFGSLPQNLVDQKVDEALSRVGILNFADKKIFNISGGEFQKCRIARCLIQQSKNLLLDEMAESLDAAFEVSLLKMLKSISSKESGSDVSGKTVLFSTHDVNSALRFADKIIVICDKSTVSGSADELIADGGKLFEREYGLSDSSLTVTDSPLSGKKQIFFN